MGVVVVDMEMVGTHMARKCMALAVPSARFVFFFPLPSIPS
jgi:hypothetical protein